MCRPRDRNDDLAPSLHRRLFPGDAQNRSRRMMSKYMEPRGREMVQKVAIRPRHLCRRYKQGHSRSWCRGTFAPRPISETVRRYRARLAFVRGQESGQGQSTFKLTRDASWARKYFTSGRPEEKARRAMVGD